MRFWLFISTVFLSLCRPPLSVTCSTCDPVQLLQRWRGTDVEKKMGGGSESNRTE